MALTNGFSCAEQDVWCYLLHLNQQNLRILVITPCGGVTFLSRRESKLADFPKCQSPTPFVVPAKIEGDSGSNYMDIR